jgi:hypothetical protein
MPIRALCLLFSFTFGLTACGGGQSGFNPPANSQAAAHNGSTISGSSRSAISVTSNMRIPVQLFVFIPCANAGSGESVTLSGDLHALATTTINANSLHVSTLFNPQGITGVGSVSGDKYQGTGVTREDLSVANPSFPLTETFVNNFRIIGQGTGNNFAIHENAHLTINATGRVTVSSDNFSTGCK